MSCQGLDQQAKVVLDRFLLRKITFSTSYTTIKKDWGKLSSTSWRGRDYINYLAFFCRLFILFLQLFQLCPLEALSCWSLCSFGMPSLLCFFVHFPYFLILQDAYFVYSLPQPLENQSFLQRAVVPFSKSRCLPEYVKGLIDCSSQ